MAGSKNDKNFFQEYFGYILLGVSSVGLLGISVYYVFFNEQPKPVVINRKRKNISDPVVDNIYWSIASFAVYYSIYSGLRYLGYKDQAAWVIVLSIFLSKIGLAAFSSYYYQKNDFDQNLEKSFHPGYFINQNMERIVISLVGYLGLVALIYFDRKKEPEPHQQPLEQQRRPKPEEIPGLPPKQGQLNQIQNKEENKKNNHAIPNQNNKKAKEKKKKIKEENKKKEEEKKNNNTIPNLNNHNQNEENKKIEEEKKNNDYEQQLQQRNERIDSKNIFEQWFNDFLSGDYAGMIKIIKEKYSFDFKQLIEPIKTNILSGKIERQSISRLFNLGQIRQPENNPNYFIRSEPYPFLNCFLACINLFFCRITAEDKAEVNNMIEKYLGPLMNDPNDAEIKSLQEKINELFYFYSCAQNLCELFFGKKHNLVNKSLFEPAREINYLHVRFLRNLVIKANLQSPFRSFTLNQNDHRQDLIICQNIVKFHQFLIINKNQIKISEIDFWSCFKHLFLQEKKEKKSNKKLTK